MINAIFKIEEYLKDRNSIVVRICRLHSHIPIDDYTAKIVDCNDLDTTDIDMFVDGLMKKSEEEKSPILKENIPDKIDGELDLQSLVGKVVEGKVDDWRRKPIKMREVEL